MKKTSIGLSVIITLIFSQILLSQIYFGAGITNSFSYKFNGGDINYSYVYPQDLNLQKSWMG